MPLSPAQKEIFDRKSRFACVSAGRRFGKSFLAIWEIARAARYPNKKIFYIAPTYRMVKQIIFDTLVEKLGEVRWIKQVNISDLTITLVNGTKIYLRSADNPDAMRGVSMDFLVLDECAMLESRMWTEVCRPALADKLGGALLISTPRGGNWFKDLWTQAHALEDWSSYQFTTVEGGNVTPEEVEAAKGEMDEKTFQQEFEANFVNFSGLCYYNWSPEYIKSKEVDTRVIRVGLDFNVTPLVATIFDLSKDGCFHFYDEILMEQSNTYEMAEELTRRYKNKRIIGYPDASGQAMKTSSRNSDHNILRQAGIELAVDRTNPRVDDRIASVNLAMQQGKFTVDKKCKNIISCLSKQVYKENTRVPQKGVYDHINDAVGYGIWKLAPIVRPKVEQPVSQQRFGLY